MKTLKTFIKKEPVLLIALAAAVISMIFVPPSASYLDYIDFKVLALLFCLMALIAGFRCCRLFDVIGQKLLMRCTGTRTLCFILVCLPFFLSMVITNDVSLIAFVPFAIFLLESAGQPQLIIPTVVMQTVAANLGSMATPVGNPQSLFLFNRFNVQTGDYFALLLPYVGISFAIITAVILLRRHRPVNIKFDRTYHIEQPGHLILFTVLFAVCLLCVFRIIDYRIMLAAILVSFILAGRTLFRQVDYFLLLTFVCFFIFSGNLGNIPEVKSALTDLVEKNAVLTSAVASQIISNVPAAILLSEFTGNASGLLVGTNIGGLGTIIASLASLIALKYYLKSEHSNAGRYMLHFSVVNFVGLAILLTFSLLF